jgi:hypothetical protein
MFLPEVDVLERYWGMALKPVGTKTGSLAELFA